MRHVWRTNDRETMPSSAPLFTAAQERPTRDWLLRFGPYGSALLGLSAVLLIWFGAAYFIHAEKQQTELAARENAANLARAFAEDILRSIRAVDQTLLYVRDSYARNPQHFDISLWSRNSQFLGEFNFQVSIIDRSGMMVTSNIAGSASGVNLSDREHFRVHAESTADSLFISKPLLGRVSRKWSIQFSRRITMPDGSFGGVVVVSVDPEYLSQLYRSIDVGQKGVVALLGTDGIIRARGTRGPTGIGELIAATSGLLRVYARSKDGFYTHRSPVDGIERIYNYRGVPDYPLIVTVGLAVDEVFAIYYRNRASTIAIAAVLTLWLLAVTYLIFRYQRNLASARDAAEAGTRARSEFLAMMSHELRTPMNGVVGMADILLDTRLDDEQALCVRTLRASASHLLQVINDVLDFSKLEAGRIEIEKIRFDVQTLLRETAALMAAPAKEKNSATACRHRSRCAALHNRRSGPVAADTPQSHLQRTEIHQGRPRRHRRCTCSGPASWQVSPRIHRRRHWHRHSAGRHSTVVSPVLAARQQHRPAIWRHRTGSRHLQASGRSHGRNNQCQKHGRRRYDLLLHRRLPAGGGFGRRARRGRTAELAAARAGRRGSASPASHAAGRRQQDQPARGQQDAPGARLHGRHCRQWLRGRRRMRGHPLRHRVHGCDDARNGRACGHKGDPQTATTELRSAHHRAHRDRAKRGQGSLSRRRHERFSDKAGDQERYRRKARGVLFGCATGNPSRADIGGAGTGARRR